MSKTLLEVKNLSVDFDTKKGRINAVHDVSFSLEAGRTLGVVGESGCGKSVSMLALLKLLPDRTSYISENSVIRMNGTDLAGLSKREMKKIRGKEISMIFQDPMTSLNPVLTVGWQMTEVFRLHSGMSRKEAFEAGVAMLEKVRIPDARSRMKCFPHELSGGMRQRVMIAMALACNPGVLIADEPTTALDVTIQAQILELMREIKQSANTSIILITHDMGVVAEMADDIMVMYAGEIVEKGSVEEIFENPKHPYTKGLLGAIPRLNEPQKRLFTIKGNVPDLKDLPKGCRFCERCEQPCEEGYAKHPELSGSDGHLVRCFAYKEELNGKA